MRFPVTLVDPKQYISNVNNILSSDDCKIFFDTNILSQLFKLHSNARNEFYKWLDEQKEKDKIRIPCWVVNEYTNRFIRNKLSDYIGDIRRVSTINKELEFIAKFLEMHVEDSMLKGSAYESGGKDAYFEDVKLVVEKFNKINSATKTGNGMLKSIHNEIVSKLEDTVLDSDVYEMVSTLSVHADGRYQNKIPPGFEDGDKERNQYGDLIVWKEILQFCKHNEVKKAILITNDGKKDIVYTPQEKWNGLKNIGNSDFSIVDPRLTFEFKKTTGSEDFYIINFQTLIKMLYESDNNKFKVISEAIQIEEIREAKFNETIVIANITGTAHGSSTLTGNLTSVEIEQIAPDVLNNDNVPTPQYSDEALADKDFPLNDPSNMLEGIIMDLKSYSWYTQNAAIEKFLRLSELDLNNINHDLLFVIGRNIYQAACGHSFAAIQIMVDIENSLSKFSSLAKEHLINGCAYEVYFNSSNQFRSGNFKYSFLNEIFSIIRNPGYEKSKTFLSSKLEPYKQKLIVDPTETDISEVRIVISYDIVTGSLNFITDNFIKSITVNGREIVSEEKRTSVTYLDSSNILNVLANGFAIPSKLINIVYAPPGPNHQTNFCLVYEINYNVN